VPDPPDDEQTPSVDELRAGLGKRLRRAAPGDDTSPYAGNGEPTHGAVTPRADPTTGGNRSTTPHFMLVMCDGSVTPAPRRAASWICRGGAIRQRHGAPSAPRASADERRRGELCRARGLVGFRLAYKKNAKDEHVVAIVFPPERRASSRVGSVRRRAWARVTGRGETLPIESRAHFPAGFLPSCKACFPRGRGTSPRAAAW
jgi:hypothetical protein